ncbi:hypothetical protein CNX65_05160 [Actinosynnema pretiosum]|uniref:VTT domain-containing protein n=2 Tax=Pseudonocardiaceae TaxID=2070 RepID=A0A290ZG85_9PSEU|nr:hypothetical protein CNX65_05160 [Actinosynnema pretiosum]
METLGAPGAGLAIALENLFPPLPSEVFLPLAGFTASRGGMSLFAAILWTTIGSVVGALALYWVGAALGRERVRRIVEKMPLVDVADVDKTEQWFVKHGSATVFFGRMIPIFRSMISIPAGVERMPLVKFTLLTTAGSAIWNSVLILAGFFLGEQWHLVETYAGVLSKVVVVLVLVGLVAFVVWKLRKRRADAASGGSAGTGGDEGGRDEGRGDEGDSERTARIGPTDPAGPGASDRTAPVQAGRVPARPGQPHHGHPQSGPGHHGPGHAGPGHHGPGHPGPGHQDATEQFRAVDADRTQQFRPMDR